MCYYNNTSRAPGFEFTWAPGDCVTSQTWFLCHYTFERVQNKCKVPITLHVSYVVGKVVHMDVCTTCLDRMDDVELVGISFGSGSYCDSL